MSVPAIDGAAAPSCFMHVPKTAGTSLRLALEAALPPGSIAPQAMDPAVLGGFDALDLLRPEVRGTVAATPAELDGLGRSAAIFGHFTLPNLLRHAPLERIATVLRESRARIVSHYLFLRFNAPLRALWGPAGIHKPAEASLKDFLLDDRAAYAVDNCVCRMLLQGDPRIPPQGRIAEADVEPIAEDAWERLSRFGFVGFIEDAEAAWRGVGKHFGVELKPVRANVAGEWEFASGVPPVPPIGPETLALLERRSAGDAILYRRIVAAALGEAAAQRTEAAAFASALIALGGYSAAAAGWSQFAAGKAALDAVHRSRSWRLTEPLRRLGRLLQSVG
jgi:hypothetical protein